MASRSEPELRSDRSAPHASVKQRQIAAPPSLLRRAFVGLSPVVGDQPGILQLQRLAGNRATLQALSAARHSRGTGAAATSGRPAPPAPGASSIQRRTELRFSNTVDGDSEITASAHNRGPVHAMAANWVLTNGAWGSVPDRTVVNHSNAYEGAAQHVLDTHVHQEKLSDAAGSVIAMQEELQGHGKGVGAPTSTHRDRLQAIVDDPSEDVDVDGVVDSFNYYMYKICDYPNNLFVWPDKTGNEPDLPQGQYDHNYNDGSSMEDWEANKPAKTKAKRLADEKARLVDGRKELNDAIN
jgi:hypothetical protein